MTRTPILYLSGPASLDQPFVFRLSYLQIAFFFFNKHGIQKIEMLGPVTDRTLWQMTQNSVCKQHQIVEEYL